MTRSHLYSALLLLAGTSPLLAEPQAVVDAPGEQTPARPTPDAGAPAAEAESAKPPAEEKAKGSEFLRILRNEEGEPLAMQTAVVRYVPIDESKAGLFVDLVGAVHIGEKSYYKELNELFPAYDAMLYELVAPEGTRVRAEDHAGPPTHPIGALQVGMQGMLGLEHQLQQVDYSPENFVHADMSPDEFAESMKRRDESFFKMFFRALGQSAARQNIEGQGTSDAELLFALFSKDRTLRLKRILAEQFGDLEQSTAVFDGPDGSTILTERNKKALEVLDREIKAGKKKLAIFYGAAHLPDMERRLHDEFHLKPTETRWINAWKLDSAESDK